MLFAKIILLALPLASLLSQQSTSVFYIKSWKQGKRQIQEQSFDVTLNLTNQKFNAKIKDASGKIRYEFSVLPSNLPAKLRKSNVGVDSWSVQLVKSKSLGEYLLEDSRVNLLKPSNDPYQDAFGPEDFVGWLNPLCDESIMGTEVTPCAAPPPFLSKRVVKVENFYVIFQVSGYHFIEGKKGVMDSLILHFEFTNRYDGPRKTASNKSIPPTALSMPFINLESCDVGCVVSSDGGLIRALGSWGWLSSSDLRKVNVCVTLSVFLSHFWHLLWAWRL